MTKTISQRAIPEREQPLSEQFRLVALAWADADAAANLQEELKTTTLEQWKTELILAQGDMPDSHAERKVKAQPRWEAYIRQMCKDRAEANKRKVQLEYLKMRYHEQQSAEATARAERRL